MVKSVLMSDNSSNLSYQDESLAQLLIDIQDRLVPVLDTYEQAIYHYIFRHTILTQEDSCYFSTKSAEIGKGSGDRNRPPSDETRSRRLRSLAEKGAVKIIERTRHGILVEIALPDQIPSLTKEGESEFEVDIDSLDFFSNPKLRKVILEREQHRCFYLDKEITEDNFCIDHVIPQANAGDNSYRNLVAACRDANSMKSNQNVEDFIRRLYRESLLSIEEFKGLQEKISKLKNGEIQPNETLVRRALVTVDES